MSALRQHWLLAVEIGGRIHRWSTERVEVTTSAGDVLVYAPGLSDLVAAAGDSVSVEVDDPSIDWPAIREDLEYSRASLRLWTDGDLLELAIGIVRGEVIELQTDSRHEPASWTVAHDAPGELLGVQVPDSLARVDATTWPLAGTIGDEGAYYPVVFGYPGYTGATLPIPVVPTPLGQHTAGASTTYVVVSEDAAAQITQVRLRNDSLDAEGNETVVRVADLLGRQVLCAHFTADGAPKPSATQQREIYVGYAPGGGGGVARSAYDVIRYLLRRWGASSVDWQRLPAVADVLSAYQVDTWIDSPIDDPWEWIESVLIPDLPVEVRVSDRGRWLQHRRYVTDASRITGAINVDAGGASRTSPVMSSGPPVNEWTALYRASTRGDWIARMVLTGDPDRVESAPGVSVPPGVATTQAVSVLVSGRCRDSHSRYALRRSPDGPLEIDWTWDTGTVARVLEDLAEQRARPARLISYDIEASVAAGVVEGNELQLTDSEQGLSSEPVIVDSPPLLGGDTVQVRLRIPG